MDFYNESKNNSAMRSLEKVIIDLQKTIDSKKLTNEKHIHNITTQRISVAPLINAINKLKHEVHITKEIYDDSEQVAKLEKLECTLNQSLKDIYQLIANQQQKAGVKTDPSVYIPVRLTDGKQFYKALDSILTAMGNFPDKMVVKFVDESIDAFARLRISNPLTVFDSKQIFDNAPLFWDERVTGTGTTSTYNQNRASTTLAVGASAGSRTRQTYRRFNYQPGKSQLIFMTGVLGNAGTGITKQLGPLDDSNGLFFQISGGILSVGIRSSVTGSVENSIHNQSNWNLDRLDGTDASGLRLDVTKSQIFMFDYEWLGVGRVRFGFVINGVPIYCHEINNANIASAVYMSTPNLPLRYFISNDGTGSESTLEHICTTVISEGGQEENGIVLSANSGAMPLDADVNGVPYVALSLRLKSGYEGATIKLIKLTALGTTVNDYFRWSLRYNPTTISGTLTYVDMPNSALQVARGSTPNVVIGGNTIDSGYALSNAVVEEPIPNALTLGTTISGTAIPITLVITPVSATMNFDVFTSLTWRELL